MLERYWAWLQSGGARRCAITTIYIPIAGYALGMNLKLHGQIDLGRDLECVMEFVRAKRPGVSWIKNSRNALDKFRHFLRQERGQVQATFQELTYAQYCAGFPEWLVTCLERYHRIRQHQ